MDAQVRPDRGVTIELDGYPIAGRSLCVQRATKIT
jgi:hypothetical protein